MNTEHAELYRRIADFSIDEPGVRLPFTARLARENGWDRDYTLRVVEEYKSITVFSSVGSLTVASVAAITWTANISRTFFPGGQTKHATRKPGLKKTYLSGILQSIRKLPTQFGLADEGIARLKLLNT